MARTAAIAGTATAVSNRVSRRQARRWSAHEAEQHPQQGYPPQQAYPQQGYPPPGYPQQGYPQQGYVQPPPAAPAEDDLTAKLDRLTVMRDRGQLTEQEFAAAKAQLLGL
jgi:hypothetical protein